MDARRFAAFPLLADLPDAELAALGEAMHEVELDAGAHAVTVDDYGAGVYFVEEGEADVVDHPGGETETLGAGDTFGEIALLLTGQRTASVVARTPMRLLALSGQDFDGIRSRVPEFESSLRRLGLERAGR